MSFVVLPSGWHRTPRVIISPSAAYVGGHAQQVIFIAPEAAATAYLL
jgi:hypothetical protein